MAMTTNRIALGIIGAALCAMIALPAFAQTDTTTVQSSTPAGPTMTMDGVISGINWNLCSDNRTDCVTVMDVTAAPAHVLTTSRGTSVAANDPVEIIVPAGGSVAVVRSGNTFPATDLRKGDEVVVNYQAYDYGNVATSVQLRSHGGTGQDY
jgi:hypothetical protein